MEWKFTDGGRSKHFKAENVGDCVVRAISVASNLNYIDVYNKLKLIAKQYVKTHNNKTSREIQKKGPSPRNGVNTEIYEILLKELGWKKSTKRLKLDDEQFKHGTYICSVRKHLTVIKDGVLYDAYDCSPTWGPDENGNLTVPIIRTAFSWWYKD